MNTSIVRQQPPGLTQSCDLCHPLAPKNALAAVQTGSIYPARHPHSICQTDQAELLWTARWQAEVTPLETSVGEPTPYLRHRWPRALAFTGTDAFMTLMVNLSAFLMRQWSNSPDANWNSGNDPSVVSSLAEHSLHTIFLIPFYLFNLSLVYPVAELIP